MTRWFQPAEGPEEDARIPALPAEFDGFPQQAVAHALCAQRIGEYEPAQMRALGLRPGAIDGNRAFDAAVPDGGPEAVPHRIQALQELRQLGRDLGLEVKPEVPGSAVIRRVQLGHAAYGPGNIAGDGEFAHSAKHRGTAPDERIALTLEAISELPKWPLI